MSDDNPPFCWSRAAQAGLTFRRITDADLPFLARVYASTRTEELAVTDWPEAQKVAFLESQFNAQHAHYQKYYPKADWLVTSRGGEDIGRLYIERWPSQHRIIDIALLPEHRGKGLGEALLRDRQPRTAAPGRHRDQAGHKGRALPERRRRSPCAPERARDQAQCVSFECMVASASSGPSARRVSQ